MNRFALISGIALLALFACSSPQKGTTKMELKSPTDATVGKQEGGGGNMELKSSAFANGREIPRKYTCEGQDVSPPLQWSNLPSGTKSLALIVDDPDAPDPARPLRVWVHWILYNIPPDSTGLPEAVTSSDLPKGTLSGKNDRGDTEYHGPCPPIGRHRYFFALYALDQMLPDLKSPTKPELRKAMDGHILAKIELMGTYQK